MKKISKETNFAFLVMFLLVGSICFIKPDAWVILVLLTLVYTLIGVVVNIQLKKFNRERKKRNSLMFDESAHFHDKPLSTRITWSVPTPESFDGNKVNRYLLDEHMMWKEATPEEAEQAKIAYDKWKESNSISDTTAPMYDDKNINIIRELNK